MSTIQSRWQRSSLQIMAVSLIAFTQSSFGQYIFFDRFDSESVGAFPSTWTNVSVGPNAQVYVTNNIPGTPSTPNAFKLANLNTGETLQVWRQFPTYSLNVVSQLVVGYRLNVSVIPADASSGFAIMPGFLPTQGEETFAAIRVYKGSGAGTWLVQNYYGGVVTNNVALDTWHDFRFEIDPSPTNAQNGVVRWYIDNSLRLTENFTVPTIARTNINTLVARETFPGFPPHPITTFYLDNVYVFAEIPEPSVLLLAGVGGMLYLLRGRRK